MVVVLPVAGGVTVWFGNARIEPRFALLYWKTFASPPGKRFWSEI